MSLVIGTTTYTPTEEGEKILAKYPPGKEPSWMGKKPAPSTSAPPPVKPRIEYHDAAIARIRKAIGTLVDPPVPEGILNTRLGDVVAVATDGHRMLLLKGTTSAGFKALSDAPPMTNIKGFLTKRPAGGITLPHEFHPAVRRMKAAGPKPWKTAAIVLTFTPDKGGKAGSLKIDVRDLSDGVSAEETLPIAEALCTYPWRVCLGGQYVEEVLGVWPMVLSVGDPLVPVVFENAAFAYVLMPMGDNGGPTPPGPKPKMLAEAWTRPGSWFPGSEVSQMAAQKTAGQISTAKPEPPVDAWREQLMEALLTAFPNMPAKNWSVEAPGVLRCDDGVTVGFRIDVTGKTPKVKALDGKPHRASVKLFTGRFVKLLKRDPLFPALVVITAADRTKAATPSKAAPTPPPTGATQKRVATVVATGGTSRWGFHWIWPKSHPDKPGQVESGEVEVAALVSGTETEKAARKAIRERYGFPQWLPDRTTLTRLS